MSSFTTTRDQIVGDAEQQRLDAERSICALKNANSLSLLMREHGLLIPARTLPLWRPTKRHVGMIDGVREGLEIIATDGILGWFLTTDTREAWQGHIQCFSGKIEPLHSFHGPMASKSNPKVRKPRKEKSERQKLIDSL